MRVLAAKKPNPAIARTGALRRKNTGPPRSTRPNPWLLRGRQKFTSSTTVRESVGRKCVNHARSVTATAALPAVIVRAILASRDAGLHLH